MSVKHTSMARYSDSQPDRIITVFTAATSSCGTQSGQSLVIASFYFYFVWPPRSQNNDWISRSCCLYCMHRMQYNAGGWISSFYSELKPNCVSKFVQPYTFDASSKFLLSPRSDVDDTSHKNDCRSGYIGCRCHTSGRWGWLTNESRQTQAISGAGREADPVPQPRPVSYSQRDR